MESYGEIGRVPVNLFTIHLDPMLPEYLEGDDQRLIQVLTNLLSNAVKFTPEKGHISLSVKKLSSEGSHCTLLFTVTDTGIGIPKEQQERLFYSFEQAESGTARKFGGTGLGLAISKRIVELMEGEIWIESDVGEGASFLFTVQLELGSPWQEPTGKKELLDGQRILVVDDAPEILDFFQEVCGTAGILCDVAPDAETALTTIEQSNTYTVYFIDYVLPGANGLALAKEILEKQKESCTVILFTGLEQQDIKEQARQIGVNQVLTKPLFPSQILDTIRKSMEQERDTPDVFSEEDSLGDLKGFRVLLAEDIEVNREIVLAVLEPAQLVIDCAENGRIALEKFRADPSGYDLLLMDMQMPEMDGCQATEAIRALDGEYSKQVPIIAMTANVFREDVERCLAAGMNDHIGKPLDYEELITKLREYLL